MTLKKFEFANCKLHMMISIFNEIITLVGIGTTDWYTVIKLLEPNHIIERQLAFFSSPNMHLALYRFFVIVSQVTIILL